MTLEKYFTDYRDLGRRQFKMDVQPNPNDIGVIIKIFPEGTPEDVTTFCLKDYIQPAEGFLRETQNILFGLEGRLSRDEQKKYLEEQIKRLFQEAVSQHIWSHK